MTDLPEHERKHLLSIARQDNLLTPRQLEICEWWAAGAGIKRTAYVLGLHPSTIRSHRAEAWRKLTAKV